MNTPTHPLLRSLAALLCAFSLPALSYAQASGTWTSTTGGNWSDITNWSSGSGPVASGAGAVATFSASGTQTVNLDANETIGTLSPSVGTYTFSSTNGSVLTLASGNSTAPVINGTANITVALAGTQGFTFSTGGTRKLYLYGDNTYTGVTTLSQGGEVFVASNNALGATGSGNGTTISYTTNSAVQLHFLNNVISGEDITLQISSSGTTGANLIYNDNGNNTLTGNITLARYSTNGNLTSGVDTFGIQSTSGTMTISGNITGQTTNGQADGSVADQDILAVRTTSSSAKVSITGVISDGTIGTGGLSVYTTSDSVGTLTLTGVNTYTGSTTINGGTFALTGSGSIADSTVYNIAAGAKFDVSGLTVPGYSLANVATTLGVGATTNGYINVGTGTLTLGGTSSLTLNFTAVPTATTFSLYTAGGVSGDFTSVVVTGTLGTGNLTLASGLWSGDIDGYNLSLNESTGLLTVATAIPEPATTGIILGAATLGAIALLRRRRKA